MKSRRIILSILCTLAVTTLYAQKLSMGFLHPAGGQVGTTVEIEAGGLNINRATKVMFSHPGIQGELIPIKESAADKKKRRRLTDQSSPQLADRIKIKISIAADVPCGMYDLRLQGPSGVSNMLPFEVASYPNIIENDKSYRTKPNEVEQLPAVLCGQMTPGGIDYFRFSGHEGETIVATVKARQLVPYIADAVPGWFQPVIKIVNSQGKEIAYSDDYHHNVDPVIIVTLPKDDKYTLTIHDAIYRGREDFNYRIHLGVIPFVTGRYPAYGVVDKKVKQTLEGANLGATKSVIKVAKEGYNTLTHTSKAGTSNGVSFYALPKGSKLIHSPKKTIELTTKCAIADSLTASAKFKRYKVTAIVGEPIIIELIGRRNGSRIDAVIRLRDDSGRVVAEADDTEDQVQGLITFHADPVLKYTPKRNGVLTLEVEDLHRGYGKDYHYLLLRHRDLPTFNAFVSPANITIPSGGTASFQVEISGKLKRPAHLEVKGLPEGFTTSSLRLRGNRWNTSITAPKGATIERFPIEVKVCYPGADKRQEQAKAVPVDKMMQAFYYTHNIQAAELAVEVIKPAPYRLSLDFDIEKEITFTFDDKVIPIKVLIDKDPDFNEPVELMLSNKFGMFSMEQVTIMPDEREKTFDLILNEDALNKLKNKKGYRYWQMHIVGTVKGEVVQSGRRRFQNAKHREITPYFIIRLKR